MATNTGKLVRGYVLAGFILVITLSCIVSIVNALPTGPTISYKSNSTYTPIVASRNQDEKGTITVLTMSSRQQDYKWKAYVGNVSGSLTLDDAGTMTIYDWSLATAGEVYVTRASSVSWTNISCVNQSVINAEQAYVGMGDTSVDNINNTFNTTTHRTFQVASTTIANSTCKSLATYVSDASQTISENAKFQEVLLKDSVNNNLIYTALIDNDQTSYDGTNTYDFQLLVAENESSTVPTTYYFYVELGQ